jgi:hypothetical protein
MMCSAGTTRSEPLAPMVSLGRTNALCPSISIQPVERTFVTRSLMGNSSMRYSRAARCSADIPLTNMPRLVSLPATALASVRSILSVTTRAACPWRSLTSLNAL